MIIQMTRDEVLTATKAEILGAPKAWQDYLRTVRLRRRQGETPFFNCPNCREYIPCEDYCRTQNVCHFCDTHCQPYLCSPANRDLYDKYRDAILRAALQRKRC